MGFKIFEQLINRKDGKQNNMQTESMKNQDYNLTVMETLSVAYREATATRSRNLFISC